MNKNFGGGTRGRKWVKFHFENFGQFFKFNYRGISHASLIITIFCLIMIAYYSISLEKTKKFGKKIIIGVKLQKNTEKSDFFEN